MCSSLPLHCNNCRCTWTEEGSTDEAIWLSDQSETWDLNTWSLSWPYDGTSWCLGSTVKQEMTKEAAGRRERASEREKVEWEMRMERIFLPRMSKNLRPQIELVEEKMNNLKVEWKKDAPGQGTYNLLHIQWACVSVYVCTAAAAVNDVCERRERANWTLNVQLWRVSASECNSRTDSSQLSGPQLHKRTRALEANATSQLSRASDWPVLKKGEREREKREKRGREVPLQWGQGTWRTRVWASLYSFDSVLPAATLWFLCGCSCEANGQKWSTKEREERREDERRKATQVEKSIEVKVDAGTWSDLISSGPLAAHRWLFVTFGVGVEEIRYTTPSCDVYTVHLSWHLT